MIESAPRVGPADDHEESTLKFWRCDLALSELPIMLGTTRLAKLALVCLLGFALLVPSVAAAADENPLKPRRYHPADWPPFSVLAGGTAGAQCQDGIVYDNGSVEGGLAFEADTLDMVMRFDLGQTGAKIADVCLCWTRDTTQGPNDDLPFEIVFYEVGPTGEPGELITTVPVDANNVPVFMGSQFYSYDLTDEDIVIADDQVYVGVGWFANANPEFFLCTDDNGTGNQPLFVSGDLGVTWESIRDIPPAEGEPADSLSRIDALMVRTTLDDSRVEPFDCVEDDTTLCLVDDRFQVKVDWATSQGTSGVGMAEELTPDTGYFWFFEEDNVEMVIKVLDACPLPENINGDRFWVFAGGLTNVEVNIEVIDSETGVVKNYSNPINTPFQPLQDTNAFATCP